MSILRCDFGLGEYIAWKHPESTPPFGSQVIVNQSQQAALFTSGELVAILDSGAHSLKTINLPVVQGLFQDKKETVPVEIWFVNKTSSTSFRWGTKNPIQVQDKKYGVLVPIGSYGSYELKIVDIQSFLLRLVGVKDSYTLEELKEYLYPFVERELKASIAKASKETDIFAISSIINSLSAQLQTALSKRFAVYGIRLEDFFIQSLSILSNDPSFTEIKSAIAKAAATRLQADAISDSESGYRIERSFDVLEKLAGNENGLAATFANAAIGLGAGLDLSSSLRNEIALQKDTQGESIPKRIEVLKELLEKGFISEEEYKAKRQSIIEEL